MRRGTNKLEYGLIPKNKECPFSKECGDKKCSRFERAAAIEFSCALARAFNIFTDKELEKAKSNVTNAN